MRYPEENSDLLKIVAYNMLIANIAVRLLLTVP